MIVVDASAVAPALIDDGAAGEQVRERLIGERVVAPSFIDLEVASVIRRLHRRGELGAARASRAIAAMAAFPLERTHHPRLLARIWELRDNLTVYDAAYVALAEVLVAPLLTADRKLAESSGPRCSLEVLK